MGEMPKSNLGHCGGHWLRMWPICYKSANDFVLPFTATFPGHSNLPAACGSLVVVQQTDCYHELFFYFLVPYNVITPIRYNVSYNAITYNVMGPCGKGKTKEILI